MNVPYFYCIEPKCFDPASFLIPMGKSLVAVCEDHFRIFERSFPQAADRAETIQEGSRLPSDYDPIIQQKKTLTKIPGTKDKVFTVGKIVGGQLK